MIEGVDTYDMLSGVRTIKVTVLFSEDLPQLVEGESLLNFEKDLRAKSGLDVRVFKHRMGDDSKLRVQMTRKEKDSL